jgi:hypothetical protein
VPEFCTCGAELPSGARFCHKCGKPQFELPEVEQAVPAAEAPQQTPVQGPILPPLPGGPREINFRNGSAVRIGFITSGIVTLLMSLLGYVLGAFALLTLVAGGFLGVYLYLKRTGERVSVKNGARLGWITGVFCFCISTVFTTLTVVGNSESLIAEWKRQLDRSGASEESMRQAMQIFQSPAGLATLIVLSLFLMFIFFTLLPAIGGALGAKVLEKD